MEQRGGVSLEYLQISNQPIVYPKFTQPDISLIMSDQARKRVLLLLRGVATTKQSRLSDIIVFDIKDYVEKLNKQNILKPSYNIFFLGVIAKLLEKKKICKVEKVLKLLENRLSKKLNWEENKKAFNCGVDFKN